MLLLLHHMQASILSTCMPGLTLWCHWWFQVSSFIVSWRSSSHVVIRASLILNTVLDHRSRLLAGQSKLAALPIFCCEKVTLNSMATHSCYRIGRHNGLQNQRCMRQDHVMKLIVLAGVLHPLHVRPDA